MEPQQVLHMLEQVASGSVSPVDAQRSLADQGYSDLGFAKVDTDRARRTGAGEVVYGAGKTADQIAGICLALRDAGQACVLVTRLEAQKAEAVRAALLVATRRLRRHSSIDSFLSWACSARRQSRRAIATSRWRAQVPATCTAPRRRPLPPRCSDRAWFACMMWGLRASIASWRIGGTSQAPAA